MCSVVTFFFLFSACVFGAAITWLKQPWPGHEAAVSALDADSLNVQSTHASILLSPTGVEFAVCLLCHVRGT